FSQIFKIICQLANLLYLTRLISSADYGVMAICFVFVNLCNLLRDLGTASAIIQKKELDNRLINAVFWLNIFIGVFLCLILMLFAPLISAFYSVDKLNGALILISFIFP
ncbi:TPA: oligosaccharide flippase family protein, partial [Klebsiella quasipneumoniae subsp. similipneumoniae]|nr:oligosaccharide flippase family protein [Klebsiella quasipneumoniae subsp. similipneumoniae]